MHSSRSLGKTCFRRALRSSFKSLKVELTKMRKVFSGLGHMLTERLETTKRRGHKRAS
jgi:hypothetical protein